MVTRLVTASLVFAIAIADAAPVIEVRATCAAELASEPAHLRTLRGELAQALARTTATASYTLDVSLVRLGVATVGRELEVRAEVRAMLSDAHGKIRWSSTSRSAARGPAADRIRLQRDAVSAAARDLARSVRAHCCTR
ncbi:MAG TPA: hypothetical protein VFV99_25890 [Kofleriaceae bacterium]|nr:hypothetical protein [Kofleriaceae bacterium]